MTCEVKVKRSGWQQAASRKKHEKANENEKQMKSASAYDIGDAKQLKLSGSAECGHQKEIVKFAADEITLLAKKKCGENRKTAPHNKEKHTGTGTNWHM